MRHLSLFTGSGIGTLAAQQCGIETVAQCENDPACQHALRNLWPTAFLFEDIHGVSAESLRQRGADEIDIISGGFPCQDLSCAGKGAGIEGSRSGLWREMFRVIRQVRPRWLVIENVPALRLRGSDRVIAPLERIGYTVWPLVVGAWAVGAPHKRDRVWIVGRLADTPPGGLGTDGAARRSGGHADQCGENNVGHADLFISGDKPPTNGYEGQAGLANRLGQTRSMVNAPGGREEATQQRGQRHGPLGTSGELADTLGGLCGCGGDQQKRGPDRGTLARWPSRPGEQQHDWESPRLLVESLGGEFDGFPARVQRRANKAALRILGNAWCYQNALIIFHWIAEQEK